MGNIFDERERRLFGAFAHGENSRPRQSVYDIGLFEKHLSAKEIFLIAIGFETKKSAISERNTGSTAPELGRVAVGDDDTTIFYPEPPFQVFINLVCGFGAVFWQEHMIAASIGFVDARRADESMMCDGAGGAGAAELFRQVIVGLFLDKFFFFLAEG